MAYGRIWGWSHGTPPIAPQDGVGQNRSGAAVKSE